LRQYNKQKDLLIKENKKIEKIYQAKLLDIKDDVNFLLFLNLHKIYIVFKAKNRNRSIEK
jgi:hypothetical protein